LESLVPLGIHIVFLTITLPVPMSILVPVMVPLLLIPDISFPVYSILRLGGPLLILCLVSIPLPVQPTLLHLLVNPLQNKLRPLK
jgi:hypothetical protein